MSDDTTTAEGEWADWAEVAAADLADPTFRALMGEIDADQQAWAGEYAATLAALRKALHITQAEVAERLGTSQSEVSRIERRDDVLVSTLRAVVTALGADLELVARFGDGHVVRIDLSDVA
ncbi:MAG: helix-turn-helix domain-containing protein [Acidimicrobiales bacterium]